MLTEDQITKDLHVPSPATTLDLEVGDITVKVRVFFPSGIEHKVIAHAMMTVTSQVLAELGTDAGWLVLAPLGTDREG